MRIFFPTCVDVACWDVRIRAWFQHPVFCSASLSYFWFWKCLSFYIYICDLYFEIFFSVNFFLTVCNYPLTWKNPVSQAEKPSFAQTGCAEWDGCSFWGIHFFSTGEWKLGTLTITVLPLSPPAIKPQLHHLRRPNHNPGHYSPALHKKLEERPVRGKVFDERGRMKKIQHISQTWNRK